MKVTNEELAGISSALRAYPPEKFDEALRYVLDSILGAAATELVRSAKRVKELEATLEAVTLQRGGQS